MCSCAAVCSACWYVEAVLTYAPSTFEGMVANSIAYREDDDTGSWLFTLDYDLSVPEATLRCGASTRAVVPCECTRAKIRQPTQPPAELRQISKVPLE